MYQSNDSPLDLVASSRTGDEAPCFMKLNSKSSNGIKFQRGIDVCAWKKETKYVSDSMYSHLEDDPNDFYQGDIYARPGNQSDQEDMAGLYHQHIRNISKGWHHLRYLADFMTVSTAPLRYKSLTLEDRHERLNRVNITVIDYEEKINSRSLRNPEQLDQFLTSLNDRGEAQKPRLIVVQDLSTLMIEKLGSTFDIEPGFFRSHIGHYVWLNTRDPQAEIPDLEAFSIRSNYFNVQYVSPRYFENIEQLKNAEAQVESFNVLRQIDHDGVFKPWSDMPGSDVGLIRCKTSLWIRPNKSSDQAWLGILLVDPTIMHGFPLWSGYGNFHPPPSAHVPIERDIFPPYGTVVQEFIFWTLHQAGSKARVPPPSPELLPLSFFTIISAQWILMCEYVSTRLGQIEWEIDLGLSNLYAQDFDNTVKSLLLWRRRMPIYHTFVERSISRISARFKSKEDTTPFDSWEDILTNLKDILHRLEILHCRADKIMAVSMAVTGREESKKATQESHAVTRISYLAFFFVPLNFWSSFFSMSGDFPVKTYWIYTAIALPVSCCALGALIFAGQIRDLWVRAKVRQPVRISKTTKQSSSDV